MAKHRNCSICGKPIVLVPSAQERADKHGGTAKHYRDLFTTHTECALAQRKQETKELCKRIHAQTSDNKLTIF